MVWYLREGPWTDTKGGNGREKAGAGKALKESVVFEMPRIVRASPMIRRIPARQGYILTMRRHFAGAQINGTRCTAQASAPYGAHYQPPYLYLPPEASLSFIQLPRPHKREREEARQHRMVVQQHTKKMSGLTGQFGRCSTQHALGRQSPYEQTLFTPDGHKSGVIQLRLYQVLQLLLPTPDVWEIDLVQHHNLLMLHVTMVNSESNHNATSR